MWTNIICSKDVIFKRLKKFFEESDKDNDGQLTVKELTATLRRYGYRGSDEEIMVREGGWRQKSNVSGMAR